MLKSFIACAILSFTINLAACRGGKNNSPAGGGEAQPATSNLDSVATDLDKTTKALEAQMEELKISLDSI